ncbi:MAG: prepilin peptidase [Alphaproteobacteria bacterium]|nr:prepilin peptidase [Alphaproteobacteria bacterium]MDX5369840.1 prepilin peptidase [Alphaproteobacteria bacterium]MDX5464456.1 prepilin peptidase [Alphaproteobacteria bacterium]
MDLVFLLFSVFPLVMIAAGISDLASFRIPNLMSVLLALAFLPFAFAAGMGWADIGIAYALGAGVLVVGFGLFSFGIVGGGDAKLLAASAIWIGASDFLLYLVAVTLAGGALCLVLLLARRTPFPASWLKSGWISRLLRPDDGARDVPYAVAMAGGLLWVLPQLEVMRVAAG